VLPGKVAAEWKPFFIILGGPKAHNFSGRDDKGEGRYGPQRLWYFWRIVSKAGCCPKNLDSWPFSFRRDGRRGGAPWGNEATSGRRAMKRAKCRDKV
jgi:hypothetical protein